MNQENHCPQCGVALPANSPQGLCPGCLLKRGLETHTYTGGSQGDRPGEAPEYAPPRPEDLADLFPDLEILELIGRGGMGVVYKARQKRLDRLVALKILSPRLSQDPAFAERFAREARAMAMLNHPQVVAVYDFGEIDGLYYFLMEFVDGVNLRRLLDDGRLAPEEALAIVPQICDALQYAHDHGVVHRDIKPENVLVDQEGRVKIADFGIAKLVGVDDPRHTSDGSSPHKATGDLTAAGQVLGTPQYMAPEQIDRPLEVDHRADIYSLGVVFYQMLTGELPTGRIIAPPSQKVQVDVRLDEVVLRAMAREPQNRYQQANEVKTQVEDITAASPQPSPKRETLSDAAIEQAKRQVKGPAIGLLITGLLTWVPLLMLIWFSAWTADVPASDTSPSSPVPMFMLGPAILMCFSILIILAALKMQRLQSYGLAVIASILAILASPIFFFVGLPIGIWALVVLSQREVRAAFAAEKTGGKTMSKKIGAVLIFTFIAMAIVAFLSLLSVTFLWLNSAGTSISDSDDRTAVADALEEFRKTLVVYDLDSGSCFPNQEWKHYDARRLEIYPGKHGWPDILGHIDINPDSFTIIRADLQGDISGGPYAFTTPLETHAASREITTLLFLKGITSKGRFTAVGSTSLACFGKMEGRLIFASLTNTLIKGDMSGSITGQSYFNLVVTGKFTGKIKADSYAMIYLLGGFEGNLKLNGSKVYITGQTPQAALGRIKGNGKVYLETSDLSPGEHKIGNLTVTVGDTPAPAIPSDGKIQPMDLIQIRSINTLIKLPVDGFYLVEPGGDVSLGPAYGRVHIQGLTVQQAEEKIIEQLKKVLIDPAVQVVFGRRLHEWHKAVFLRSPYTIEPKDVLWVDVSGTSDYPPIDGLFTVEPGGTIPLGPAYGRVAVNGLTLEAAGKAIKTHLQKILKDPEVQVMFPPNYADSPAVRDETVPLPQAPFTIRPGEVLSIKGVNLLLNQPIEGLYLVEPAGTVALGPAYGRVKVQGLSLAEAEKAIREKLKTILRDPDVAVTLGGWPAGPHTVSGQVTVRGSKSANESPKALVYRKMDFAIGPQSFAEGDKIEITEVRSTRGTLATGDIVIVKGNYTLMSHPEATLSFYVTQSNGPHVGTSVKKSQRIKVAAGSGSFALKHTIPYKGHCHVSYYPASGGSSFGDIYFGTKPQMKEIEHWDLDAQRKSSAPSKQDVTKTSQTDQAAPSAPTTEMMRALAERICNGDEAAFGELQEVTQELYRDIDYQKEEARVHSNLVLMYAAFNVIGEQVGQGNAKAFKALKQSLGTPHMKSFAPNAFGIAAAAGHEESLDILLHHRKWGILLSSTVFALQKPAEKNNPKAVDFLVKVLEDPQARALWHGASEGLVAASVAGNQKAKAALEKYEKAEKERSSKNKDDKKGKDLKDNEKQKHESPVGPQKKKYHAG